MPNFPNYTEFAFSFSHAIIKAGDRQFMGIDAVRVNQDLNESAVFGAARGPLKRSAGQLQMGQGMLRFSDYADATDFLASQSPDPMFRTWNLDYTLVNEQGSIRSVECRSCRLISLSIDHQAGAEALGAEYPFSFLSMRVNGIDLALSPGAILSAVKGLVARGISSIL